MGRDLTVPELIKKLGIQIPKPDPARYPPGMPHGAAHPLGFGRSYLVVTSIKVVVTHHGFSAIAVEFRSVLTGEPRQHIWFVGQPGQVGSYEAARAKDFLLACIRGPMIKTGPGVDAIQNAQDMHNIDPKVLETALKNATERNDLAGARVQCHGSANTNGRGQRFDWYPEKHNLLDRHLERLALGWVGYDSGVLLGDDPGEARGACERRAETLGSHWVGAMPAMVEMWMRLADEVERAQVEKSKRDLDEAGPIDLPEPSGRPAR